MRRLPIAVMTALTLGAVALAMGAQARPGDRLRARFAERIAAAEGNAPTVSKGTTLRYGADPAQTIAFWPAQQRAGAAKAAPLIVFVHGGGWSRGTAANGTGKWKEAHFPMAGYALASIDYRLVPGATVEDEASDVARALKALLDRAASLGIDRRRVVLMGHSAGAHLVVLVGTDGRYLKSAGLSFGDVAGVVPIDGAAYDVPAQMRDGPGIMQRTYGAAFGSDPARQRALSPTLTAAAHPFASGNAPKFLLIHVQRPDGVRQAEALEAALTAAGAQVERDAFEGTGLIGHLTINRRLGDPDYPATATVDRWLAQLFAR